MSPNPQPDSPGRNNGLRDVLKLTTLVVALLCSAWFLNKLLGIIGF